jgi:hypothetical protein
MIAIGFEVVMNEMNILQIKSAIEIKTEIEIEIKFKIKIKIKIKIEKPKKRSDLIISKENHRSIRRTMNPRRISSPSS